MDALAQRAIALIKKRGSMRDNQLATELDSDWVAVAVALAPHCASGELVSCKVNLVGKGEVNEYRMSATGPRKADEGQLRKPPTPPEQVLAAAKRAPAPRQPRTEGATMPTLRERILDAYAKHGPMTARDLRAHVNAASAAITCSQLAGEDKLVRLGGGAHSTIYGLPGQKLPKGDADAATAPAKRKKAAKAAAKKRSAPVRKVQRKTAKKVQKTVSTETKAARPTGRHLRTRNADLRVPHADAPSSAFRAAIASDGAMIFLGAAAGAFELNRGEARALVEFVRTLDRGEAGLAHGAQA